MKKFLSMFATKTVGMAILGAAQYVIQNDPSNIMTWVNAATGVFGVAAARQAIEKNGPSGQQGPTR